MISPMIWSIFEFFQASETLIEMAEIRFCFPVTSLLGFISHCHKMVSPKLPYYVNVVTPPETRLGIFTLDKNTRSGDVVEYAGKSFEVASITDF
jgi:hypothetical protein